MKIFLYGLYAVFLFAMGTGFYFAFRGFERLVEENYYERAMYYFTCCYPISSSRRNTVTHYRS